MHYPDGRLRHEEESGSLAVAEVRPRIKVPSDVGSILAFLQVGISHWKALLSQKYAVDFMPTRVNVIGLVCSELLPRLPDIIYYAEPKTSKGTPIRRGKTLPTMKTGLESICKTTQMLTEVSSIV